MATRPCPRCSKLVPETAAFCRRCGHRLPEKTNTTPTAPRDQARTTRAPATARALAADALPLRPRPAGPFGVEWRAILVTAVVMAATIMVQFMASLPTPPAIPSDPGPPAVADVHSDAGARQLARMHERIAAARQRTGSAGDRLAAARKELDWRLAREAQSFSPKNLSAAPAESAPAESAPASARPRRAGPDVVSSSPVSPSRGRWPGRPRSIDDVARANVLRGGAPRITGYSRASGAAGSRVSLDGGGLAQTSRVLFAAPTAAGNAWRDADFRVRDDGRLIVTVPDLGPSPRPAMVLVVTPHGAAVIVSHDSTLVSVDPVISNTAGAGLYFVAPGASLTPARGSVVVVDRGATVRSAAASLLLVRAGGGVERARADCLIVRETPRPEARDLSAVPVLDVPALNTCFLDSAFQYTGR